eukprot:scpid35007/ scgid27879/ Zinc finger protein 324A; Zinc finger protein ZF5128
MATLGGRTHIASNCAGGSSSRSGARYNMFPEINPIVRSGPVASSGSPTSASSTEMEPDSRRLSVARPLERALSSYGSLQSYQLHHDIPLLSSSASSTLSAAAESVGAARTTLTCTADLAGDSLSASLASGSIPGINGEENGFDSVWETDQVFMGNRIDIAGEAEVSNGAFQDPELDVVLESSQPPADLSGLSQVVYNIDHAVAANAEVLEDTAMQSATAPGCMQDDYIEEEEEEDEPALDDDVDNHGEDLSDDDLTDDLSDDEDDDDMDVDDVDDDEEDGSGRLERDDRACALLYSNSSSVGTRSARAQSQQTGGSPLLASSGQDDAEQGVGREEIVGPGAGKKKRTRQKFSCKICQKTFSRRRHLNVHEDMHTNTRRYSCEKCGAAFRDPAHLHHHRAVHSELRPHQCDKCDKAFKHGGQLHRHQQVHDNSPGNRHVCKECGRGYTTKHNLDQHKMIHNGKSFDCTVCNKRFVRKLHLENHMRTHTGERPHICKLCNASFTQASGLARHMRTLHKDGSVHTTPRKRRTNGERKIVNSTVAAVAGSSLGLASHAGPTIAVSSIQLPPVMPVTGASRVHVSPVATAVSSLSPSPAQVAASLAATAAAGLPPTTPQALQQATAAGKRRKRHDDGSSRKS